MSEFGSDLAGAFSICHRQASRRWKRERALKLAIPLMGGLAATGYFLAVLALRCETAIASVPGWLAVSACLLAGGAVWAFRRPVAPQRLWRKMDRLAGLPDDVLAAGQWGLAKASEKNDFWRQRIMQRTAANLRGVDWAKVWPCGSPRHAWLCLGSFVVVLFSLVALWLDYQAGLRPAAPDLRRQERLAAMQKMLDRWQEPPPQVPAKEWAIVSQMIQPLVGKLQRADVSEQEVLLDLSRVEDELRAKMQAMHEESLGGQADDLAAALEQIKDMGQAAAAMRRKDFKAAADNLAQMSAKTRQADPAKKMTDDPVAASQQLSHLGQKMKQKGAPKLAGLMEQMAEAAQKNDRGKMADGLDSLGRESNQQCLRDGQSQSMNQKIEQLDKMKGAFAQNTMPGQRPGDDKAGASQSTANDSKPGKENEEPGGLKAGTEKHDQPFGNPTELEAQHELVNVAGNLGEGESQVTKLHSNEGLAGRAADKSAADFGYYEKLSRQAVADETIPLSHRESIRRYFQLIHPPAIKVEN